MDDIREKQYVHLRSEFDRLRWMILGVDYFTISNDVYGSDSETTKDIVKKYNRLEESRDYWRGAAVGFGTFAGAMLLLLFMYSFTL